MSMLQNAYSRSLKEISKHALTYDEWLQNAREYDLRNGLDTWKYEEDSPLYDNVEIRSRLEKLRNYKKNGDNHSILFALNEGIHGNMGGMGNPKLYSKSFSGTKKLIVDYVDEVADAINHIAELDHEQISLEEKLDFFQRASLCFGRTALMLSGGGQLGHFHMGVLKALIHNEVLPNVISGSSAGSICAALVGSHHLDELKQWFRPENLHVEVELEHGLLSRLIKKRGSIRIGHLRESVERIVPDMTFQEAYEKTGRYINISVAPFESYQKSRLLNAIASPNVMIRSAVMASCAIPGVFPPVSLLAKNKDGEEVAYLPSRKWVDGSMSNDLPSKRLTRMYGVNHFIVSMTNPIVLPFIREARTQNEWLGAVRRFGTTLVKETSQFNYTIAKPFFKYWPKLAVAANSVNSIVQQYYRGDINIAADFSVVKPSHLLSSLTYEEIEGLIVNGEKATWPYIQRILLATKVARLLDRILLEYEKEELQLATESLKGSHSPRT